MFAANLKGSLAAKAVSIISVFVLVVGVFPMSAAATFDNDHEGDSCGETFNSGEKSSDDKNGSRYSIDFQNDDETVSISAKTGYELVKVEVKERRYQQTGTQQVTVVDTPAYDEWVNDGPVGNWTDDSTPGPSGNNINPDNAGPNVEYNQSGTTYKYVITATQTLYKYQLQKKDGDSSPWSGDNNDINSKPSWFNSTEWNEATNWSTDTTPGGKNVDQEFDPSGDGKNDKYRWHLDETKTEWKYQKQKKVHHNAVTHQESVPVYGWAENWVDKTSSFPGTYNPSDFDGSHETTITKVKLTVKKVCPDVCPNISGEQYTVPQGKELVGGQCVDYVEPNASLTGTASCLAENGSWSVTWQIAHNQNSKTMEIVDADAWKFELPLWFLPQDTTDPVFAPSPVPAGNGQSATAITNHSASVLGVKVLVEVDWNGHSGTETEWLIVEKPTTPCAPDNTAPVVTLNGASTVTLTVGDMFVDAGATWADAEDGSGTTTVSGSVDTSIVGTTTLTYSYTDNGGLSDSETRTVIVNPAPEVGCPEGQHMEGETCVDDGPTGCPQGQHLEGETCVDDEQVPPSEPAPTVSSGGSTGGGKGHTNKVCSDSVDNDNDGLYDMNDPGCENPKDGSEEDPVGGNPEGEVLGAACGPILNAYLGLRGQANDPEAVKFVQEFLNKELGLSLEVNGDYDAVTIEAVKQFQAKYFPEVITPWGISDATGIVYKTTQRMINKISCPSLDIPMPELE